jgi:syntaxin-binding protein 1
VPPKTPGKTPGKSARTKGGGWAKRSLGGDAEFGFDAAARENDGSGASLDELGRATTNAAGHHHRHARTQSAVPAVANRRLVVFVVGGVSFGETREAAALAAATQREVIFGGTSVHAPERFVETLARLGNGGGGGVPALRRNDADVELDDIVIED